jgi:hypothetical protein
MYVRNSCPYCRNMSIKTSRLACVVHGNATIDICGGNDRSSHCIRGHITRTTCLRLAGPLSIGQTRSMIGRRERTRNDGSNLDFNAQQY